MQSKRMSIIESFTQPAVGLFISYAFTYWGLPFLFDVQFGVGQSIYISACYFVLSVVRMYCIRRFFNVLDRSDCDLPHRKFRKNGTL